MKHKPLITLGIVFTISVCMFSCNNTTEEYYKYRGEIQGTYFTVIYEADKDYAPQIDSLLQRFNQSLNNYDSTSLITQINRNEHVKTDSLFNTMYGAARKVWKASGGYFDITIAPLANAWGFGYKSGHVPDSAEIDSLMQFVGMENVYLENGVVGKLDERVEIIGNAIAKGMSVDYLARYFESKGIKNYLVDIGGEIRAKGESEKGKTWLVGVDKPIVDSTVSRRELQTTINLDNMAVATSGDYRKYRINNGKRYGHSINPKTGYPAASEILSATVVHPQCMYADAWSTAFMAMKTPDEALDMVNKNDKLEAMFITGNSDGSYEMHYSDGFDELMPEK
ncbi:MAG: FAD:protein FMN transferase [Bacteroidales bacterium]